MTAQQTSQNLALTIVKNVVAVIRTTFTVLFIFILGMLTMIGDSIIKIASWIIEATGGGRGLTKPKTGLTRVVLSTALIAAMAYSLLQWVSVTGSWDLPFGDTRYGDYFKVGMGVALSLLCSIQQARFLRQDHVAMRAAKFQAHKQTRISEKETDNLIDIAQVSAKDFNAAAMRSYRIDGLMALASWVAEYSVVNHTVIWPAVFGVGTFITLGVSLATVFSVEAIIRMIEEDASV